MNKVYVNCGGRLVTFDSKKEVLDFYEDCIMMCEGSERERYTNIYFSVKNNLGTDKRCFSDGTDHVFDSNIDPDNVDYNEEKLLKKYFDIDKNDLLYFKANNYLAQNNNRIYQSTIDRYEDIDELYKDYIIKSNEVSFFIMQKDKIICVDATACPPDNYWIEEFDLKDYEYADKWLGQEIEYDEYLEAKKKAEKEIL